MQGEISGEMYKDWIFFDTWQCVSSFVESSWRNCFGMMLFSKDHTAGFWGRSCSDLIKHEEGGEMFGIAQR